MQPLNQVTPSEADLPRSCCLPQLASTVVLPDYFRHGIFQLELPPAANGGLGVDLEYVLQGAVG